MYNDGTNKISIDSVEVPQSIFKNIAVSGQSDVVADGTSDTLTLVAGTNMTLTTNAGTDTITLASSGSGGTQNLFSTVAVAGQNDIVADSTTDTLTLAAGSNITLTTDQATDTLTITSTAGSGTLSNIVEDTTPQLGGSLDVNGQKIVSVSGGDIDIEPDGTGDVLLGNFKFDVDQTVGVGQDNYVMTYDNSTGKVSLEASAAATSMNTAGNTGTGSVTFASETLTVTGTTGQINVDAAAFAISLSLDQNIDSIQSIKFEGSTSNTSEIQLTSADPSTDRTITLPDASGTVCVSASGNLALDVNGNMTTLATVYTNSDVDLHLNTSSATSGQILSWTGSDYDWVADQTGGGGGTPGGSNTEVQFNNAGAFAGDSDFTYNSTTNVLTVGSIVSSAAGTPTITSNSAVNISVGSSVVIQQNSGGGGFRVGNMTTAERNSLTAANGEIVYNTSDNQFEVYQNGAWVTMISTSGIASVVADTTPELGGNLDVNGKDIVSSSNGDIEIKPNGSGDIHLETTTGMVRVTHPNPAGTGIDLGSHNMYLNSDSTLTGTSVSIGFQPGTDTGTTTNTYSFLKTTRTSNTSADFSINVANESSPAGSYYVTTYYGNNQSGRVDFPGNVRLKADDTNYASAKVGARNVFNITAPNAPNHYTFNDPDSHWFPTAKDDPQLYLRRGETYYFVINASGHPFEIRDISNTIYNVGVTNNTTAVGTIIWKVPMEASGSAYKYVCTNHAGDMTAAINIS